MTTEKKPAASERIARPIKNHPAGYAPREVSLPSCPAPRLRPALISLACAAALALGGCASPEAKRAEMESRMGPPQPRLGAKTAFFNGDVLVEVSLVSVASFPGGDPSKGPRGRMPGGGGEPSGLKMDIGGGGGGGMGMGGGGGGGGMGGGGGGGMGGGGMGGGGPPEGGMGGGGGPPGELPDGPPGGGMRRGPMMPMPREALHVLFSNTGKAIREIEILDVNSQLGNFAPRPDHVALAPSQRSEIEPMPSNYPANLDALDVEVRLRAGNTVEKQTLHLIRTDGDASTPP